MRRIKAWPNIISYTSYVSPLSPIFALQKWYFQNKALMIILLMKPNQLLNFKMGNFVMKGQMKMWRST